jgi:hypothetical protein
MNQQLNLGQMGLENISLHEAIMVEGGTYASGYSAGNTAGKYVKQALTDWGILTTIKTIVELF